MAPIAVLESGSIKLKPVSRRVLMLDLSTIPRAHSIVISRSQAILKLRPLTDRIFPTLMVLIAAWIRSGLERASDLVSLPDVHLSLRTALGNYMLTLGSALG